MPIDGPLIAIDGPHGTAMAIDELRLDLSTGRSVLDTKSWTLVNVGVMPFLH